jgi:NADPH-dependent glutamate synthase beta subunit-like oxidoreductase
MNTRIGTDITLEQIERQVRRRVPRVGRPERPRAAVEGAEAPNVVTATAFLKAFNDGRMQHVGKRVVVVGGGDTSIDVATVARRLGPHRPGPSRPPENAIAGHAGARRGATSRAARAPR